MKEVSWPAGDNFDYLGLLLQGKLTNIEKYHFENTLKVKNRAVLVDHYGLEGLL